MMKTILVIEDDEAILEVVKDILENEGFNVFTFNKLPTVDEITGLNCHLIISDHRLRDGFGGELCSRLKRNPVTKAIPFILFSANADIGQIAAKNCTDAFIAKPFEIFHLLTLVQHFTCL
ncbi:MAG TPA: response regulator [Mucilaginibacter sp.]|nr:response regulator [Mucilaginibacter sp.]